VLIGISSFAAAAAAAAVALRLTIQRFKATALSAARNLCWVPLQWRPRQAAKGSFAPDAATRSILGVDERSPFIHLMVDVGRWRTTVSKSFCLYA